MPIYFWWGGQIVGGRGCGKGQGTGGKKGGARGVRQGGGARGVGQGGWGKGGGVRGVRGWNLYLNEVLNKTGIVTHLGCHNKCYDTKL